MKYLWGLGSRWEMGNGKKRKLLFRVEGVGFRPVGFKT